MLQPSVQKEGGLKHRMSDPANQNCNLDLLGITKGCSGLQIGMDDLPGPYGCTRPLLEGNSDESNEVQDPDSTGAAQMDWLTSWDSLGRPASANRALLWDLMDILAIPKFREEFKLGFKAVVGLDWNDCDFCGNELQRKLDSNPKSKFKMAFNKDQRPLVLSGKILEWDITLLRAAIKALVDASNSTWNPAKMAEIDALKNLRNTLGHKGAHHFKDDEFEPMYETFKNNVIALGWSAEEIDAARKHLRMPKNVFEYGAPTDLFYGRQNYLRKCEEAVRRCLPEQKAKNRMVAIQGFGGMGKTQLARHMGQILQSYQATEPQLSFDVIFSFDAQTEASLEKGFRDLAQHLGIRDKLPKSGKLTMDDISLVYVHLGRYYKQKVLFIFDNAEQLKAVNGKFGLKTYLGPRNDCCGPVFLVTSRDPWHLWIDPSKCIKVDELTAEDARSCLLGYMRIPEDGRHSEDFKKSLESLVKLIGGHPLGLKLCGSAIENKVRRSKQYRYSWTHGVKDYLYLLSQKPLHEFSGEAKYKERVGIICKDTLAKIRKESQGSTATALLGIIAYLAPDYMELGLVKCIHLYERPGTNLFWAKWDDLPVEMREEMNILLDYSLIDLYVDDATRDLYGNDHINLDKYPPRVKIHRLVQECTRELIQSDPELNPERDPLQKIMTFSDRYNLPRWDIAFILNLYATNPSQLIPLDDESKWKLCSRIAQIKGGLNYLNVALEDLARNDEEKDLVKLFLLQFEYWRQDSEYYSELYIVIKKLCHDYCYLSGEWFIESCSSLLYEVIRHMRFGPSSQDDQRKKLVEISGWVLQGYMRSGIIRDISRHLLRIVNFFIQNGGSVEPSLVPKIFSKSTCKGFWSNFYIKPCYQSRELLACLFPCPETDLFTTSLQSLEESRLYDGFMCKLGWGRQFCGLLNKAAMEPQLRWPLSEDRDRFVHYFWNITEWTFDNFSPHKTEEILIPTILSTWCGLFSGDENLYEFYRLSLDNKVAAWLELSPDIQFDDDYTSLRKFPTCKHCSIETRRWIEEICRLGIWVWPEVVIGQAGYP